MENTFSRRARIVSVAAGFAVAAGLTFGGPFIHPPVKDTVTASVQIPAQITVSSSASAADRARCAASLVDFVEGACDAVFKPVKQPVVDRRETFDWI